MNICFFPVDSDSLKTGLSAQLQNLDDLLIEHQLAFMEKDWKKGIGLFEQVYELRRYHLNFMEDKLLMLFRAYYPRPPHGARPLYFIREKKLILKKTSAYVHLFGKLFLAGRMGQLQLPRLFDEYVYLKDLLDHHDAREKGFLFTLLDSAMAAKERLVLLHDYRVGLEPLKDRWVI